jgi:hypothetical protein
MKKSNQPVRVVSDMGTVHFIKHWFISDKRANLFMEINKDYGVLCIRGNRIYLEKLTERGIKL